jgi:hypothetical protein
MTTIPAIEVAEVFRQSLRGEIAVKLIGDTSWRGMGSGNVEYSFGAWRITLFNDAMDLDYVDSVVAPDGRTAEYEDWFKPDHIGADPVDLLTNAERNALESLIEGLEPEEKLDEGI